MSHISTVSIPLKDIDVLKRALEKLGLKVEANGRIRAWDGNVVRGDLVVQTPATSYGKTSNYGVAFVRQGDSVSVQSDWEASLKAPVLHEAGLSRGWNGPGSEKIMLDKVGQAYSRELVVDNLAEHGFVLDEEEVNDTGQLTLTARRFR